MWIEKKKEDSYMETDTGWGGENHMIMKTVSGVKQCPTKHRSQDRQGWVSLQVSEGGQPCRHPDFECLAFRTMR